MMGGDGRICAFQPTDCPEGTAFVTPRQLEQSGGGLAHGGACTTRDGADNVAKIGSCTGDTAFCASDASLCPNPVSFVAVDDRCTIHVDGVKQGGPATLFGKCHSDNTCYWSQQDCLDPSTWVKPTSGSNNDCTCEKVRVGACVDPQGFHSCAVSEEACSSTATWVDASTLMRNSDAPDCLLCPQSSAAPLQGSPGRPSNNSVMRMDINDNAVGGENNKTAIITGVVVGGTVLLGLLVFSVVYMRRVMSRRGPRPSQKNVSDIPIETITDVSRNNQDIEELSMDDGGIT